jgi:hypothetical protein
MGGLLLLIVAAIVLLVLVVLLAALVRARGGHAQGGGEADAPVELRWGRPSPCYPAELVAGCLEAARAAPGFGPVTPEQRAGLAAAAARLSAEYGVPLRPGQLVAVRNMEVALEARRGGLRALRLGDTLLAESRAGGSILAIAARHRLPPLAVLRQVLVEAGRSEAEVKGMLAAPERLPPALAAEAPAVFEADLGSRLNADRIKARSQAYEAAVEAHLRAQGLARGRDYQTEDDLRRAQEGPGRAARPTPDFLFLRPVAVRGRRVRWLDAKDYMLYGSKLVTASLAKQARKYTAHYGPGAMVFSGGLMCGARVLPPGTDEEPLLLDGSHLVPAPPAEAPAAP